MVEVKDLVLEERVHLLEGVRTFASFVTNKYPQTNEEDELNYYISGSLAVMLLSQAHSMDLLNPLQIPKISSRESRLLPINFTERLCSFTRKRPCA